MQKAALISIILPAYNAESFIAQAVESVVMQSYTAWELIVINDGSTDGTHAYLDSLIHPAITVIHQKNRGVSAARNLGLDLALGDYITFLDADDVLTNDSLMLRAEYLNDHSDIDVVDGRISVRDEVLNFEYRLYEPYYQGNLFPRLIRLDSRVFMMPCYMFRRNKLFETRFNESMTHCEDILFFMTLASRSLVSYGFVDKVILLYRRPKVSAMSNMQGIQDGYIQLLSCVTSLNGVTLIDMLYLRLRVARILFLSWLSRGRSLKGLLGAIQCFI